MMKNDKMMEGMKVLAGLVLLFVCHVSMAQTSRQEDRGVYGYGIDRNNVYYDGEVLKYADARTFVYLGHGYAKDRANVYFKGMILPHADPQTFKVLGDVEHGRYNPMNNNGRPTYRPRYDEWDNRLPDEALPGKSLGYGYSKDSFDVYYYGKSIEGASSSSFNVLIDGYAKDSFDAYFEGRKIPDCMVSSFRCLGNGVAEDTFNKYYLGRKIKK